MEKGKKRKQAPKTPLDLALEWPGYAPGEDGNSLMSGKDGDVRICLPMNNQGRLEFMVLGHPHDGARPKPLMMNPFIDSSTVGYLWPLVDKMNSGLPPRLVQPTCTKENPAENPAEEIKAERWPDFLPLYSWQ